MALAPVPNGEPSTIQGLPEELLSIIVDTSFFHDTEDVTAENTRRSTLEGYLMSWSLIFNHFVDSVCSCAFKSLKKQSFRLRSKYLEQLSEGTYVPTLFLAVMRELYLDTERPVDLSKISFDTLDLGEAEDEESKLQANTAFVFSQALNYASAPVRAEWFDLRDRLLQERIQKYQIFLSMLMPVMWQNFSPTRSFLTSSRPLKPQYHSLSSMTRMLMSESMKSQRTSTRNIKLKRAKRMKCRFDCLRVIPFPKLRL